MVGQKLRNCVHIVNVIFGLGCAAVLITIGFLIKDKIVITRRIMGRSDMVSKLMNRTVPYDARYVSNEVNVENNTVEMFIIIFAGLAFLFAAVICIVIAVPKDRVLLRLVIILAAIGVGYVFSVIFYYHQTHPIYKPFNDFLDKIMSQYIVPDNNQKNQFLSIVLMLTFQCCGLQNSSDFDRYSTQYQNGNLSYQHYNSNLKLPFLLPCCRFNDSGPVDQCPSVLTPNNSYVHIGCGERIRKEVVPKLNRIIILSIGVLALLGIDVIAIAVLYYVDKYDVREDTILHYKRTTHLDVSDNFYSL